MHEIELTAINIMSPNPLFLIWSEGYEDFPKKVAAKMVDAQEY